MKKRLPIILLVVVAVAAGVYFWRARFNQPTDRIDVSGNLELTLVDLSFKTAGRMTELDVREGDTVKKGQVIARIDPAQIQDQHRHDVEGISNAQSGYQQLETSIEYQQSTLESTVASKKAELAQSQAKLDELLAGNRTQDIQQAAAGVSDAEAQLTLAKADWERAQTLFKNDDISRSQYDQAQSKFNSTTALLKQAQEKYGLAKEGARKEDIAGARADVARAEAAVSTAEADRIDLRRKREELVAMQAQIEQARAQAGISQSQLDDTVIVAPIDGVVLVKSAEAGEVLAAGTTVVTVGDVEHPWLRAYIGETDLGRVKLGQKATLTTDSYAGKSYAGTVSFISSQAEFTPKQIQTKEERVKLVYRIKIDVDNASHDLKDNMPVDAVIQL